MTFDELLIVFEVLQDRIQQLESQNKVLQTRIVFLEKENEDLRAKLHQKEHKKNSTNSSVPPSKDENRPPKNQSLREKGIRKAGGQEGHKGNTLEFCSIPDERIDHVPEFCIKCSEKLTAEPILVDQRQVIDIPPIRAKVYQHDYYNRSCSCCGHINLSNRGELPKAKVYYGPKIEALIGYLSVRQYLSVNRIAELMDQLFGVPMSEGTVVNKLISLAKKCKNEYDDIIHQLFASTWVGSDETSFKMNGRKHWLWTWQNDKLTYLFASNNRASTTITKALHGVHTQDAILVHDCYSSHFSIESKTHQICLAHLLRDLNFLIEKRNSSWPYHFKKVLMKAIVFHKKGYFEIKQGITAIKAEINKLIEAPFETEKGAEYKNFRKRMIKYKDYILSFLDNPEVPPDNNGSERAIRNVKVKLKVSGQFKTPEGAGAFSMIRSIIDTALKQNMDPLQKLQALSY